MKWSLVGPLSSKKERKQCQYKLPSQFKWRFLSFLFKRGIKKGAEIMEAAVKINHCPADKFASLTATSRAAMIQPRRRIIIMKMNMVIKVLVVVMWRGEGRFMLVGCFVWTVHSAKVLNKARLNVPLTMFKDKKSSPILDLRPNLT